MRWLRSRQRSLTRTTGDRLIQTWQLPPEPPYYEDASDHVLVDYTPGGDLLAVWMTRCWSGWSYRIDGQSSIGRVRPKGRAALTVQAATPMVSGHGSMS